MAPIAEAEKTPLMAISILDKVTKEKSYVVRHFVSWQVENHLILKEVARLGYKRVAVITTINDATLALRDGFVGSGLSDVVINEEFNRDDMDFRAVIAKINVRKPDAVYLLLFAPQSSTFMKMLRASGFSRPVFAVHNVQDESEVVAASGTFEGIWFITGDDSNGAFYFKRYEQRFGGYPAMGGANAFDLAKMIIEAAQQDKPLLPYLKTLKDFQGVFGTYSAGGDNDFEIEAGVKLIRNAKFEDVAAAPTPGVSLSSR